MQITDGTCHDLLLGNDHALEAGKALVEALLDGLERQQVTKTISSYGCDCARRDRLTVQFSSRVTAENNVFMLTGAASLCRNPTRTAAMLPLLLTTLLPIILLIALGTVLRLRGFWARRSGPVPSV